MFRYGLLCAGVLASMINIQPAAALSGREYLQLDASNRALHVMGMVEAMKYTDDLSGTNSLKWLFQCAGSWTGVQFEQALSDYIQRNRYKLSYRTPSLLVSAVGSRCPNAPMWAR
ncbi:MAG: hypothetical protein RIC29_15275 [Rhodospirillaceae bacterium]